MLCGARAGPRASRARRVRAAQADAIEKGALPKCEYIYVQNNDFDNAGKEALKRVTKPRKIRVHFGWPPPLPGVDYE